MLAKPPFCFVLIFTSCEKNDTGLQKNTSKSANRSLIIDSRQQLESLSLDKIFNINPTVYQDFLENVIFENGHFRGAKVTGINKILNTKQKKEFWNYFGLTYDNGFSQENNRDVIYEFFKPRVRGCKHNPDWICVIRTDDNVDIQ